MAGVVVDVIVIIVVVCSLTVYSTQSAEWLGESCLCNVYTSQYYWTLNVGHFITEDSAVYKPAT